MSFNGTEAMDIVKGPGSAVYGPQGQGPGGYVNLVRRLLISTGSISIPVSRWATGPAAIPIRIRKPRSILARRSMTSWLIASATSALGQSILYQRQG